MAPILHLAIDHSLAAEINKMKKMRLNLPLCL